MSVFCSAMVEEKGPGLYWVTVTGLPPYDETRIYGIVADDDNKAAHEGLRRFIAEMEGDDHAAGARIIPFNPTP